jgi:riboflavin synthase
VFTGIVEELGSVEALELLDDGAARLVVHAPHVLADVRLGDSIAVNGVCLTVTAHEGETFTADVMQESLLRSTLGELRSGARVNLERAATLTTRLGGHLVQGHVDARGTVLERRRSDHWEVLRVSLPPDLARYVVLKGSISVDGTSLTVSALQGEWFEVSLIPETLRSTTLGLRQPGDEVNLEVDVIAKHVERLLAGRL